MRECRFLLCIFPWWRLDDGEEQRILQKDVTMTTHDS